ncbi:unnamed protein product [Didymodactylos carnosus]|uniref:Shuttle craft n=1 Tax=Didymodactylos carnosus TaxID=1234261 RepID=A0A813TYA7_9BILA|nr:unnamed protein product [Didymodactylos carnosus]CAF0820302.1 unnamed protein product [Didymodactylos carnosus]CAF3500492.1 unnamed protein product [Didymodactylos carnosus]CAF3606766.1 unnamed protein product [Didymodactylos carnosus]
MAQSSTYYHSKNYPSTSTESNMHSGQQNRTQNQQPSRQSDSDNVYDNSSSVPFFYNNERINRPNNNYHHSQNRRNRWTPRHTQYTNRMPLPPQQQQSYAEDNQYENNQQVSSFNNRRINNSHSRYSNFSDTNNGNFYYHQQYYQQPIQQQFFYNSKSTQQNETEDSGKTENLRSTLIEQLRVNDYDCMICFSKIQREQPIWSCEVCYKMFHLFCIKKWANSEESGLEKEWRCPGCQKINNYVPNYLCFCRKKHDPLFMPGETSHACGDVCGKHLNTKSADCTHICTELCHPGPCPTCTAVVKRSCLCGSEKQSVVCSSQAIIKCENVCNKLKNCKKHSCNVICHPSSCDLCTDTVKQSCYSHGNEREVPCTADTSDTVHYTCDKICNKLLSCGNHYCQMQCHYGSCSSCPLLPENCKTCSCGKTLLTELLDVEQRTSCLDPVPVCNKRCHKTLECGPLTDKHTCESQCHNGICPPCEKTTVLKCRCGNTTKPVPCPEALLYDTRTNPFLCDRRCNKKKMCGKHRCTNLCCNQDIHICDLVCGKQLNCGIHTCTDLCHKSLCRKCMVNSYEELTCECGKSIIPPPVPCGTKSPTCTEKCQRTHPCGHPVYHSCHNEPECPPCTHLVSKMCVGGHTIRDNVPCHLKDVICGQLCGKLLVCGVHLCQRFCHTGTCLAPDQKCPLKCEVKRQSCPHSCNLPCHGRDPCPKTVCRYLVQAKCACGRLTKDVYCNTKPNDDQHRSVNNLAQSLTEALSVRTIDIVRKRNEPEYYQAPVLECDDDCKIAQRNRSFAQALNINVDEHRSQLQAGQALQYSDWLKDIARRNTDFVQMVEKCLQQLVDDTIKYKVSKRCYSFKPMKTQDRKFIHELAAFYNCETQAQDPEPQRNVVAFASFGTCKLPIQTLSDVVKREKLKVPPPVQLL